MIHDSLNILELHQGYKGKLCIALQTLIFKLKVAMPSGIKKAAITLRYMYVKLNYHDFFFFTGILNKLYLICVCTKAKCILYI